MEKIYLRGEMRVEEFLENPWGVQEAVLERDIVPNDADRADIAVGQSVEFAQPPPVDRTVPPPHVLRAICIGVDAAFEAERQNGTPACQVDVDHPTGVFVHCGCAVTEDSRRRLGGLPCLGGLGLLPQCGRQTVRPRWSRRNCPGRPALDHLPRAVRILQVAGLPGYEHRMAKVQTARARPHHCREVAHFDRPAAEVLEDAVVNQAFEDRNPVGALSAQYRHHAIPLCPHGASPSLHARR